MNNLKIYRIRQVCEIDCLKPSTIYKQLRHYLFLKPTYLTSGSTDWSSSLIHDWVATKLGEHA